MSSVAVVVNVVSFYVPGHVGGAGRRPGLCFPARRYVEMAIAACCASGRVKEAAQRSPRIEPFANILLEAKR